MQKWLNIRYRRNSVLDTALKKYAKIFRTNKKKVSFKYKILLHLENMRKRKYKIEIENISYMNELYSVKYFSALTTKSRVIEGTDKTSPCTIT